MGVEPEAYGGAPRGIAIPTRSRSAAMRNYFTILL